MKFLAALCCAGMFLYMIMKNKNEVYKIEDLTAPLENHELTIQEFKFPY